ncbi:MAG: 50S ribosomal protein L24 [Betaproteobacteria bacterium]|jgi:large subunit ribosomal protein L24|nr:50S ribosomal protein L24 [Betaproteobacteria bacterium]MBT6531162.1 50S ribosomal protein L24 [Betaproteobacteria bacterium]MBT7426651.1 50S ribosomal protein L24 [Betaproteobacteria bacterium]MDG2203467.1 50S ribosomal protein L24 [Burkholderiales bacterium]
MEKIRKGDQVIVTSGKDKGKQGTVLRMMTNSTVVVEGINLVKKHQKGNPMSGDAGGIITKEMPIQRSNLAVFNTATQKGDRVGIKTLEDGSRARIFRSNGEMVDS